MTSREKFEQAIKARFGDLIDYRVCKNSDGEYMAWDMQVAWWAWQAAETDMAVQLANAESKCRALAAENAYLLPKAASELSNAWVLHKYLIGIQSAIMYLDGGNKKAAQEWLYGTISGPGFEFPDEVEVGDDIDAWATHQMRDSISYPRAVEIIKAETPATDAFLAEVRAQGVEMAACSLDDVNQFNYANMLDDLAQKIRKEGQ